VQLQYHYRNIIYSSCSYQKIISVCTFQYQLLLILPIPLSNSAVLTLPLTKKTAPPLPLIGLLSPSAAKPRPPPTSLGRNPSLFAKIIFVPPLPPYQSYVGGLAVSNFDFSCIPRSLNPYRSLRRPQLVNLWCRRTIAIDQHRLQHVSPAPLPG